MLALSLAVPLGLSDERDEPDRQDARLPDPVRRPLEDLQLLVEAADRDHHPPSGRELGDERLGDPLGSRRHQDRVEGGLNGPA
jgi:hypothetical protein